MEILELMKSRHSVRQYKDIKIEEDIRQELIQLVDEINNESGLHFQIFFDEAKCFDSWLSHYGKFTGVSNYVSLAGAKDDDLVKEKVGYYGEMLGLRIQELGLNYCFVVLTHGKSKAILNKREKQYCIIAFGYGVNPGINHKVKDKSDISNVTDSSPQWFKVGVEAALLAPTALNQQKFFIEYVDDNTIIFKANKVPCAEIDLGIVKYHFELASGKRVFKK